MQTKTPRKPLKRKAIKKPHKPLKASKAKKTGKRVPLEKKTARELVKIADKDFAHYVRLRDAENISGEWVGKCITCPKKMVVYSSDGRWSKTNENCHFIGREIHLLRYDEANCNLGCTWCNKWRDKSDMYDAYKKALDKKYGPGTAKRLQAESKQEGSRKLLTKPELLQIIRDSRVRIDVMLEMGYN